MTGFSKEVTGAIEVKGVTKRTGMKRLTGYSRGGGVTGAIEAKGVTGRTERKRVDRV